jgi:hypothetical protein
MILNKSLILFGSKKKLKLGSVLETVILWSDRNTAYFHAMANQRRQKKKIDVLDDPCGSVNDTKSMLNIAVSFYKDLFSCEEGSNFWDESDLLTDEERLSLDSPFSEEEEIENDIMCSYACGALALMAFLSFFTKSSGLLLSMTSWLWLES